MTTAVPASDAALSEQTLQASLRDIRLPGEVAGAGVIDLVLVAGLAGCLAVVLLVGLRFVTGARQPAPTQGLERQLDQLDTLTSDQQRVALLHLLRRHAPERYRQITGDLYKPGMLTDLARLRDEVRRCV